MNYDLQAIEHEGDQRRSERHIVHGRDQPRVHSPVSPQQAEWERKEINHLCV